MARSWYMDDSTVDQRLEHHCDPCQYLSLSELFHCTGVEFFEVINYKNPEADETLNDLKIKRGYTYEDEIACSKTCSPNYELQLQNFYTEHLHTHEEIRLILEGSGYFDVRDKDDRWIRIRVNPGDLIIIPSGIYHRFTLDINNFIRARRFFIGEPIWLPYNRPAEEMLCRKEYLKRLKSGFKEDCLNI